MEKRTKIILWSVIAIIALIIIVSYISLVSSKTVIAQIEVEQGIVSVNGKQISGTSSLSQGDVIETSAGGLATVILYESIVINLEENTKISLDDLTKEHPTVSQESGSIFSQITNLFGINSYTVKSGNSVASVRGTSFAIEKDKIFVDGGEVEYELDGKKFKVLMGKAVEKIEGEIRERELTPEERERINQLKLRAIEGLKKMRDKEMNKHPLVLKLIKKTYGLNDSSIQKGFELADKDEINLSDFREKSPVNIKSVDKIIEITAKIRDLNQRLN